MLGQEQQKPKVTFAKVIRRLLPTAREELCFGCLGEKSLRNRMYTSEHKAGTRPAQIEYL